MYYGAYKISTEPDGEFIETDSGLNGTYYDFPYYYTAKACSLKGKEQGGNGFNRSIYNTMIKNKGTRYNIESYIKHCYILGLLMLVCKARDIENAIGKTYPEKNQHTQPGCYQYTTGTGNYYSQASFNINSDCLFRSVVSSSTVDRGMNITCFGICMFHGHNSSYIDGISGSLNEFIINNIEYNLSEYSFCGFEKFVLANSVTNMLILCNGAVVFPSEVQADTTKGWKSSPYLYNSSGSIISSIYTLDKGYFGFTLAKGGRIPNITHASVRFTVS